jgi:hypothetical protein
VRLAFALVAFALFVAGCQTTFYDEYRARHPEFRADLPEEDSDLEQVLASIYAPQPDEKLEVKVRTLEIYRTDAHPWRALAFESVRAGDTAGSPTESYAVIVDWTCEAEHGLNKIGGERRAYYLLPGDRLAAWDHVRFRGDCALTTEYRAARGPEAATESEVTARIRKTYGKTSLELDEVYRRGLAYVEAGRLLEAQAMLTLGERGFRAAELALRRSGARLDADPLAELRRLRASLMRALGVEESAASMPRSSGISVPGRDRAAPDAAPPRPGPEA